jgi:hypothetical protein
MSSLIGLHTSGRQGTFGELPEDRNMSDERYIGVYLHVYQLQLVDIYSNAIFIKCHIFNF